MIKYKIYLLFPLVSMISLGAQADTISFRYIYISTSGSLITNSTGWANKEKDAGELLSDLMELAEDGKAKVESDETVLIEEVDKDYVLKTNESSVIYAVKSAGTNDVYTLEEWDIPVGNRLVVRQCYRPLNEQEALCIELWWKICSMVGRKEFEPFPSIMAGEPILETEERQNSGFFWEEEHLTWFLSLNGVDDDWKVTLCQVEKIREESE